MARDGSGNGASDGTSIRSVLLVEDEALIAMDLEDTLLAEGLAEVTLASTFEEASQMLDARAFDLALFDLDLEGISSLPLVEARQAAGRHSIVTSGYEDPPSALGALGVPVLNKPVRLSDLRRAAKSMGLNLG